ncbi:MAG: glycosyltransferase family 4 protein [Pseudomonadota bacterium]
MMRVLTLSNLYPNPVQPRKGVFVRERLRYVEQGGDVSCTVIAPVPWFPVASERFGQYGEFARVPKTSDDAGRTVYHPRYFLLPKIGARFAPRTYAHAVLRTLRQQRLGPFDVIDAHFMFPDAAAAILVGRALGLPVVATARGSDLNVMPADRFAGPWIRQAVECCDAAVAVSAALGEQFRVLGADESKVHVLRNGVDRGRFQSLDRGDCRRTLDLDGNIVLSVGNLVDVKGHDLLIAAMPSMPDCQVVIVGRGSNQQTLEAQAQALGCADRLRFVTEVSQDLLVQYYNAADVLVLPSRAEGMPNVVLESLACGTPVVATAVGGVPEILGASQASKMIAERDPNALAEAVRQILAAAPSVEQVQADIANFDWEQTADALRVLFDQLASRTGIAQRVA